MRPSGSHRDVLFGLMATRLLLVSQDHLHSANAAIPDDGSLTLAAVLVQQGVLSTEESELLERLVDLHVERNGNDTGQALQTPQPNAAASSTGYGATSDPAVLPPPMHSTGGSSPLPGLPGGPRFQKIRFHAHGGLGEIHLARDCELGREVALKEIRGTNADNSDFRARFVREAEITGKLEHPGIVPIYGLGFYSDGRPFYAMRFIHGRTMLVALKEYHALENTAASGKLRSLRQLLGSFIDVCNTLAYAHSRGVVHRDMKPENVMLGPFGETLVVDWGIGKILGDAAHSSHDEAVLQRAVGSDGLTGGRGGIGTLAYMSPEQAKDSSLVTPSSDVYSLGATLYHLLTGKYPDPSDPHHPPRPRMVCPTLPVALEAICLRAMALRPEDRYASARDLAGDIQNWLADEPTAAHAESLVERVGRFTRKHRAWTRASALAFALVALVGISASILIQNAQGRQLLGARINLLSSDFAASLERFQWDELPRIEQLLVEWKRLDENSGTDERERLHQAMVKALDQELRVPSLEPEDRVRIESRLSELAQRDPTKATVIRTQLEARLGDWKRLFTVVAPFENLDKTLDAKLVRTEESGLVLTKALPLPYVATRVQAGNNFRFRAVFDAWASVAAVGLLLDHTPSQRYQLVVSVPVYSGKWDHDEVVGRLEPKLGQQVAAGEPACVLILRNGIALRQTTVQLGSGPLELFAERLGGRITFQVNRGELLTFEDPFALTSAERGVLGIYWPQGARLQRLEADRQSLPAQPTPMEKADALLAAERPAEALLLYEGAVATARLESEKHEARFKMACCLEDLKRLPQAENLLEELTASLPARPRAVQPGWPVHAACKLWLFYLEKARRLPNLEEKRAYQRRADKLLDRLSPAYTLRELAPLVPAKLRRQILEQGFPVEGPIFTSAFRSTDHVEKLERAVRAQALFDESSPARRLTQWRLMIAYRVKNRYLDAIRAGEDLLDDKEWPNIDPEEKMAMWREFLWTLREAGKSERALREIDQLLRAGTAGTSAYRFLLVERARIHAAADKFDLAEKDIEQFFAVTRKEDFDYTEYADACLVRAMIRFDRKDTKGAEAALRLGMSRDWKGGLPTPPQGRQLTIRGSLNRANGITFSAQISSLLGQLSETEAETLYSQLVRGTGTLDYSLRSLAIQSVSPPLWRRIILGTYDHPRGREITRKMVYRILPFRGFIIEPLYLTLASSCFAVASADGLPDDIEPIIWKGVRDIHAHYETDKIGEVDIRLFANLAGKEPEIVSDWNKLAPKLDPELRLAVCYLFAFRALTLKQPQAARPLLREIIEKAPLRSPLARSAQEQLDKLSKSTP